MIYPRPGRQQQQSSSALFKDKPLPTDNDKYMIPQAFFLSLFFLFLIGLLMSLKYHSELSNKMEPTARSSLEELQLPDGVVKLIAPALSYELGLRNLQDNPSFRAELSSAIAKSSHRAIFFEMPAITRGNAATARFECVIVPAPSLASTTDSTPFSAHLSNQPDSCSAITFLNLGGDATLVVPCQRKTSSDGVYAHLAAFIRGADPDQIDGWWSLFATAALERISDKPLWISTSGGGVSYLHGRLDSTPKYYTFLPYKTLPLHPQRLLGEDASSLIGLTEAEAVALIQEQGLVPRVVSREGVSLPATRDFRQDRINLTIDGGRVRAADKY